MPDSILAIRIHAGFNASSFTAGLLALTEQTSGTAGAYLRSLFPGLDIGLARTRVRRSSSARHCGK